MTGLAKRHLRLAIHEPLVIADQNVSRDGCFLLHVACGRKKSIDCLECRQHDR